jgi:hypothetical protein
MKNLRNEIKKSLESANENFINAVEFVKTVGYKYVTIVNIETGKTYRQTLSDYIANDNQEDDWSLLSYLA